MFTLVAEKSKFFRVKRGQKVPEIENMFNCPVGGNAFAGRIIELKQNLSVYVATVGDTYKTVARKTGTEEDVLKKLNFSRPVYPTCKIFVPH